MPETLESKSLQESSLGEIAENFNRLVQEKVFHMESPIERAMELIGDKYSFQIIHLLYQFDRQRFVELEEQISGISPRTLSARLKHLERYDLINRHQFPTIPPKVEYSLTEKGTDLANVLNELQRWTNKWFPFQPKSS